MPFKSIQEAFAAAAEAEIEKLARRLAERSVVGVAALTDNERAILEAFDLPELPKEKS